VGKTEQEIEYAIKAGVYSFNVESEPELERINDVAGRLGAKAPVAVRVNPNVDAHTHKYISTGKSQNKFGVGLDRAAEVYSDTIKAGLTHIEAEEAASAELYRGLHFSAYNTLANILWDEFSSEIPEDNARAVALEALPLCANVLAKYDLTDDFADNPQHEQLYTELTGTIQILLDDGSL